MGKYVINILNTVPLQEIHIPMHADLNFYKPKKLGSALSTKKE